MTPARALIVAAPSSGSGKTITVAGLLRALVRRGVRVCPAKSGPDYIDPRFHALAARREGPNLDTWAMSAPLIDALLLDAGRDAELVLVESAMGLFDGAPLASGSAGSAADLAARHAVPVLLVLDVARQFQTAAAVARGLATHDPAVQIAGVVLNRVASARHGDPIRRAMRDVGLPVLGAIPQSAELALPSRHLGLVQADEHAELDAWLDRASDLLAEHLDLEAIQGLARLPRSSDVAKPSLRSVPPPGRRVALASDAAFTFVYPHVLRAWEHAGVDVVRFSPLANEAPPAGCDACWLPGGYPELHAEALARAHDFRDGLRCFAQSLPVHGECGGYMVLGRTLEDAQGRSHPMTGLLGHCSSFAARRLHIGYREAHWHAAPPAGFSQAPVRGHEFHYATLTDPGSDPACAELFDARGERIGPAGGRRGNVTGTFFHAIAEWTV